MDSTRSRTSLLKRPTRPRSVLPVAGREWQRAREWHNPLRGLTLSRAIQLIETYPRGEYADLMWTLGAPYVGIETADADLSAILSRRCNALAEMDWNATPKSAGRVPDAALAAEQVAAVRDLIEGIGNLYEAIDHLQVGINRGFAHCEIIEGPGGEPVELRPVDQWCVVRDGIAGGWRYNPEARQTTYDALPPANELPEDRFVIRVVARPLGRIALVKFVRCNLSEADWGAFVERYGLATGVVVMPPDVAPEDEASFLAAAASVAQGGDGALPHGSVYTPNSGDKGRGAAPFAEHLDYWQKKLVLVGTNGRLTMLAEAGSGTLAGNAHADTFAQLARGDARAISELIQRQVVVPWLQRHFPGRPVVAEWALAFREEVDGSAVIDDAAKLAVAGYRMSAAELAEKTGYALENAPSEASDGGEESGHPVQRPANMMQNAREGKGGSGQPETEKAARIDSVGKIENRETRSNPVSSETEEGVLETPAGDGLSKLLGELLSGGVAAWEGALRDAAEEGVGEDGEEEAIRNNCGIGSDGFEAGNRCAQGKGPSREPRTKVLSDLFGDLPGKGGRLSSEQNIQRARKAIAFAMAGDGRDAPRAVIRDELGAVDFPYGKPGNARKDFSDGFGLSHIGAKHPGALDRLPEVISRGEVYGHPEYPESKRLVILGNEMASIKRKGRTKGWLLTSFEERPERITEMKKEARRVTSRTFPD